MIIISDLRKQYLWFYAWKLSKDGELFFIQKNLFSPLEKLCLIRTIFYFVLMRCSLVLVGPGKNMVTNIMMLIADIICCGKGIGSGLPLSAVLSTAEIMDLPSVGNMSSTHSANPLSMCSRISNIRIS